MSTIAIKAETDKFESTELLQYPKFQKHWNFYEIDTKTLTNCKSIAAQATKKVSPKSWDNNKYEILTSDFACFAAIESSNM